MSRDLEANTERKIEEIIRACRRNGNRIVRTFNDGDGGDKKRNDGKDRKINNGRKDIESRGKKKRERRMIKRKRKLERRIAELEWINERKERNERKSNIVIKGVSWKTENLKQEITEYIKENIKVNVEIKRANKIEVRGSKEIIIAEINKWEERRT